MFDSIFIINIALILLISLNISVSVLNPRNPFKFIVGETINKANTPKFDFREDDEEALRFNYALDPTETKLLALTEEHLVSVFSFILRNISATDNSNTCLISLQKYLNQYNQDTKAVSERRGILRAEMVTENPNLAFRMIRRIFVTLSNKTFNLCKNLLPEMEVITSNTFAAFDRTLPTQQDLNDGLIGMLIIHYVYGFNATTQVRLGIFDGIQTHAILDFEDCLALGNKAIQLKANVLAYQWFVSASISLDEMTTKNVELEMKALENSWLSLQMSVNVSNSNDLQNLLQNKTEMQFKPLAGYEWYETCRGKVLQPLDYQSKLHCYYQFKWDPYFYINPVKTQILSWHPVIFQFYDFIGDTTIDFIRKSARQFMSRSGTVSNEKSETEYTHQRTSMHAWFPDRLGKKIFPKMVKLSRRVEKLTGLEVLKKWASQPLQVVMYGSLGGHYVFHTDSLQNSTYPIGDEGDRIATFLMFLSDVKLGGFTAFPMAGTFAKPEKGSAIFWFNIESSGEPDDTTMHGGCPVILGTKQIANRWILQYENMFKEPCSSDPSQ